MLERLLDRHSAEVLEYCAPIYGNLCREDVMVQVEELVSHIENYDFELAKQTLISIKLTLGER